ncbi:Ig-like domain-containing protein [Peptoclostridium litorale DSM 5388]|uniref:SbsA Ig-like domain-containing protein n=1 Tax=Peptoclostridium litorale DSM 5388 TaxID=1121324 RepID=A0A069RDX8_PEPLI|nr:Ig-like domain-containing protein [Peptoclostridium litorale]KDR94953.1 hypothetical protein CLIT_12c00210 [Peptoclostridium litorale DSM 5388]SIO33869.1 Ig-like domain-containing protein [Peptoclostridium litorale DSM 5388]
MKKSIRLGIVFVLTLIVSTSIAVAKELPAEKDVWAYKEWRIEFNEVVNPASINGNIYVQDQNGYNVEQDIGYEDDGKIIVLTPKTPYELGQAYTINVLAGIKSFGGENLSEDVHKTFSTSIDAPWSPYIVKTSANSISLNWYYSEDLSDCKYRIYESNELYGEYTRVANSEGGYEWSEEWRGSEGSSVKDGVSILNLPYAQSKYYKISAVKNGIESDQSNAVNVTVYSGDEYIDFIKNSRLNGENYDLGPVLEQYFKSTGYSYSFNTYGFEPWAPIGNDEVVFTGVTKEGSSLSQSGSIWDVLGSPSNDSEIFEITFKITEYDNGSGSWTIKSGKLGNNTLSADEAGDKLRLIYDSYSPY